MRTDGMFPLKMFFLEGNGRAISMDSALAQMSARIQPVVQQQLNF